MIIKIAIVTGKVAIVAGKVAAGVAGAALIGLAQSGGADFGYLSQIGQHLDPATVHASLHQAIKDLNKISWR